MDQDSKWPARDVVRARLGALVTCIWLVASALYAYWKRDAIWAAPPDALANFFTGMFSPVAFLWLVLGYYQQGDELRQSNEALRKQSEETERLAEQAVIQSKAISANEMHARRDTFFRIANILEKDIEMACSWINSELDEEWHDMFANLKGAQCDQLVAAMEADRDGLINLSLTDRFENFAVAVKIFLARFEVLLQEAHASGGDVLLYHYRVGSMGRVYRELCRYAGREAHPLFAADEHKVDLVMGR